MTFEALVNAYSADLYRYAYWLCKEANLAEDMVQETFMRAWKSLHQLEKPESAKSWLFTILRRELSRHLDRQKLELVALDNINDNEPALIDSLEFDRIEIWALQRALKKIEYLYLEPLLLQIIGGYSCEDIGQMLGIKTGAVMTRVSRARQQLRHELSSESTAKLRVVK